MSLSGTQPQTTTATPDRRTAWLGLSFRARAIGAFVAFGIGLWVALAAAIILNARVAVEEEVSSSFAVASLYLTSRKAALEEADTPDDLLEELGLQSGATRHVRALVMDGAGRVIAPPGPATLAGDDDDDDEQEPPAWFFNLLAIERLRDDIPLAFRDGGAATVVLMSEPHDEILEVWQDFRLIMPVTIGFTILLMGASVLLLNTVFRRICAVTDGLEHLHGGRMDVRLENLGIPELAAIADRFNDLAERLSLREAENRDLNRRLLTLQDDERRQIAQDLHDEIGPYLFGLRSAATRASGTVESVAGPAGDLADLAQAIQVRMRRLITSLRPMALGEVPLAELVEDLVATLTRLDGACAIGLTIRTGPASYGEAADLTVYRFIQESVVNALRHGQPRRIDVEVGESAGDLVARVSDDGSGPRADAADRHGYGFAGIADRARALGGVWNRPVRRDGITLADLRIPIEHRHVAEHQDTEATP
ncbi:histidine kinase [Mongoliimonas terrestris]|uniref:histidine kinase n=1 Tax=Mongoliimonas terrestris TaxID=1709001 RepID=UPI000949A0F1|nr:histidine kinase [Mongoliimonas terrestris]